jgi:hypothetical protein
MSRGVPLGILLALAIATGAGGYSFLDLGIGGPVYTGSARGSAMGEVGWLSEENAFATVLNPATLGTIDRPDVAVSYQYYFLHETRAFPAYDSFDALLGYNVYATNKDFYQDIAVGFATGSVPRAFGLSFGVMYSPVYDLNYDYEEEIRDRSTSSQPADELVARAYVISEGTLKAVSFGVARALAEEASVGISLDYVFGSYDVTARVDWAGSDPDTKDEYSASKQSGMRLRFGGRIKVGPRLEAGFEATTRCAMKGDFSMHAANGLLWYLPLPDTGETAVTYNDVETDYPASIGIGVTFKPRNELTTVLELGMRYTAWSDFSSEFYGDFDLVDVYSWHAGVEHVFYNGMPLRFGLIYSPSPREEDVSEAAFTFGTGYKAYGWTVDFSGRIGWQKYRYPDLFDDAMFGMPSREPGLRWRDEVRETSLSGRLSFTRRF